MSWSKTLVIGVVIGIAGAVSIFGYLTAVGNGLKQENYTSSKGWCGLDSQTACDSLRGMRQQTINTVAEPVTFEPQATSLDVNEDKPNAMVQSVETMEGVQMDEVQPAPKPTPRIKPPTSSSVPITD